MAGNWQQCKNILCIRPDNMGDLIMTGPALRALKATFNAKITVLTSSMAAAIARQMPEIDDVIVADLPWVKTNSATDSETCHQVLEQIRVKKFDAAVIFTVYSQNSLPSVMLAYLAGIPKRLAYCRENPYQLLTDWHPDQEPYTTIKHQVTRDLALVASVGAATDNDALFLPVGEDVVEIVRVKLKQTVLDPEKDWLIFHPGVSEAKRRYPIDKWIAAGKKLILNTGYQILITGSDSERQLTNELQQGIGYGSCDAAGLFNLTELTALISLAPVIVSVNTGPVHIAAAVKTPVVVLYALTNPQHTPWKTPHIVLSFTPDKQILTKNEVIRFVNGHLYNQNVSLPNENDIICAVQQLLSVTPQSLLPLQ